MSDNAWDWWFGDGPGEKKTDKPKTDKPKTVRFTLRPIETVPTRRIKRQRLLLQITGFSFAFFSALSSDAAEPTPAAHPVIAEVVRVATLPSWERRIVHFAMLDESTSGTLAAAQVDDPENTTEDEARRKRLRELLREDDSDETDRRGDGEASAQSDRPKRTEIESEPAGLFSKPFIEQRLPELDQNGLALPPLRAVSTETNAIGNGKLPEDFDADQSVPQMALPEDLASRALYSQSTIRYWAAPNTFSHPLYFEDRMLERHGHERWGCMQPIAAGARFFTTIPMLPYLATVQEPCETVYSKGYYRAGSPVPKFVQRPPMEQRAVVVEAAVVSGAFIALP